MVKEKVGVAWNSRNRVCWQRQKGKSVCMRLSGRDAAQVRLVDAAATQPLDHSRALGTHARTLELFEQFGFAEEAVKAAADMGAINMCSSRGSRGQISLSVLKELDTPFPKFLGLPQVCSLTTCRYAAHVLRHMLLETSCAACCWGLLCLHEQ